MKISTLNLHICCFNLFLTDVNVGGEKKIHTGLISKLYLENVALNCVVLLSFNGTSELGIHFNF